MSCGGLGLMAAPHSLLASACVLAGLLTAGLIVTVVHCQKKMFRGWLWPKAGSSSCSLNSLKCCRRGYSCDNKYQSSPGTGSGDSEISVTMEAMEASLYYSDRTMLPYSLQSRPASQAGVSIHVLRLPLSKSLRNNYFLWSNIHNYIFSTNM